MASGDTKTEALLNILGNGGDPSQFSGCCNTKTQTYLLEAIDRVQKMEDEVEELRNNPDVVDIVDTYTDLENYDTSTLTDKDIIRVLEDSTHDDNSTYYRWNAQTEQFDFVGEIKERVVGDGTSGASNTTYRGADLSEKYTDAELSTKVQAGDFSGIYIGDYITKRVKVGANTERTLDFVVAGIDYWYGVGDQGQGLETHHLLMVPDTAFYELAQMNGTNTTTGGYYGSAMHGIASPAYTAGTGGALTSVVADYETFLHTTLGANDGEYTFTHNGTQWQYDGANVGANLTSYGITYSGTPVSGDEIKLTFAKGNLEPYRQAIYTAFGDSHILTHRTYMTTSTSAGAWHNARVELMNECMVYGSKQYANNEEGERIAPIQLPYFAMNPQKRVAHRGKGGSRSAAWLSSIGSGSNFCYVNTNGYATNYAASTSLVVRPYFLFA